jgi:hypothetical protein
MFANVFERRAALIKRSQKAVQPQVYHRSFSIGYPKLGESSSSSSPYAARSAVPEEAQYDPTSRVDYFSDLKGDHGSGIGSSRRERDSEDTPSSIEGILEPESFGVSRPGYVYLQSGASALAFTNDSTGDQSLRRNFYNTPENQPES